MKRFAITMLAALAATGCAGGSGAAPSTIAPPPATAAPIGSATLAPSPGPPTVPPSSAAITLQVSAGSAWPPSTAIGSTVHVYGDQPPAEQVFDRWSGERRSTSSSALLM